MKNLGGNSSNQKSGWKTILLKVLALVAFLLPALHLTIGFFWMYSDGDFCIPTDPYVDGYHHKHNGEYCDFMWEGLWVFPYMTLYWLLLILSGIWAIYRLRIKKS